MHNLVMTQPNNYPHLVAWFEVPAADLDRAAKFYSDVLGVPMKVEQFGSERLSVFPHQEPSVGGSLTVGGQPPAGGVVLYLNASPSLDAQPAYAGRRRSNGAKNAAPPVRVFTRRSAIPKATSWGCMPVARADASCRQIVGTYGPPPHTARQLASWLEVSQRTNLPGHSRSFAFWRSDRTRSGLRLSDGP